MIGALISKIWPWIALAAAVVAGFFGVRISARREGAANERARQRRGSGKRRRGPMKRVTTWSVSLLMLAASGCASGPIDPCGIFKPNPSGRGRP